MIGGLITILLGKLFVGAVSGPEDYRIVVAGTFNSDSAASAISAGIANCEGYGALTLGGRRVSIESQPDAASGPRASAQAIAEKEKTLMVIGHFTSTSTAQALPIYLDAQYKIPVILTTETNPDLIPKSPDPGAPHPVFRLWPTDDRQAKDAADYAAQDGSIFWIVEDMSDNYVYSHYLARKFADEVWSKKDKKIVLWSDARTLPSLETVASLNVDTVFFAGGWQDSLVLIEAIAQVWPDPAERPRVFLTDAAAHLLNRDTLGQERVYITHPLPPPGPSEHADRANERPIETGYATLARDTCTIVRRILIDADPYVTDGRNWFVDLIGYHSISGARRAVADSMFQLAEHSAPIEGANQKYAFERTADGRYATKHNGCDAKFHVWKLNEAEPASVSPPVCPP